MFLKYYIVFGLIYGIHYANGRKYDLDGEALKLYGEDLESVVKMFRKTPEYLSILQKQLEALEAKRDYIASYLNDHYEKKIAEKVKKELNYSVPTNVTYRTHPISSEFVRPDLITPQRREMDQEEDAVKILDRYWANKRSKLDPKVANRMIDIGFELAGEYIHDYIKAVSPDDELPSTLLPADDDDKYTTHDHQVEHKTTSETAENEFPTSPPDFYRNYRPQSLN